MSEGNTELRDKLAKWLSRSGYPLEMKVAALLRKHSFSTFQSEYYLDRQLREMREIDAVGVLGRSSADGHFRFTVAIECKTSPEKPWVVFSSEVHHDPTEHITDRASSSVGGKLLTLIASRRDIQQLPLFKRPERAGYAIVRGLGDGQDVPYTAMMSAAKAADTIAWEASGPNHDIVAEVVFPVVVFDGNLFECYLDDEENPLLVETTRRTVYWRNPIAGKIHSVITVTTIGDLSTYLDEVSGAFTALITNCDAEISASLAAAKVARDEMVPARSAAATPNPSSS